MESKNEIKLTSTVERFGLMFQGTTFMELAHRYVTKFETPLRAKLAHIQYDSTHVNLYGI